LQIPALWVFCGLVVLARSFLANDPHSFAVRLMKSGRDPSNEEIVGCYSNSIFLNFNFDNKFSLQDYILQLNQSDNILDLENYPSISFITPTHFGWIKKLEVLILTHYLKRKLTESPWNRFQAKSGSEFLVENFHPTLNQNSHPFTLKVNPFISNQGDYIDPYSITGNEFKHKIKLLDEVLFIEKRQGYAIQDSSLLKPKYQKLYLNILDLLIQEFCDVNIRSQKTISDYKTIWIDMCCISK
jgi:hypothetical protein